MANSHHLWDNEKGLKMYHLCLESLVCFFIIFSIYLNASTTTTTTLSNRSSRCDVSQAQVRFFWLFLYWFNYNFSYGVPPHHLRTQGWPKKGSRCIWSISSPGKFFIFFFFTWLATILLIDCHPTIQGPNNKKIGLEMCQTCLKPRVCFFMFFILFYFIYLLLN